MLSTNWVTPWREIAICTAWRCASVNLTNTLVDSKGLENKINGDITAPLKFCSSTRTYHTTISRSPIALCCICHVLWTLQPTNSYGLPYTSNWAVAVWDWMVRAKTPCWLFFLPRCSQLAQDLGLKTQFVYFEFEVQCSTMLDRWFS